MLGDGSVKEEREIERDKERADVSLYTDTNPLGSGPHVNGLI